MSLSDHDLIVSILEGDKDMFAELVGRYQRPVYNLLRRYTGNSEEAEDLAQEVFVRAYDKLWTFRPDQQFFPWLYTIAVNRAHDWSRRRARERAIMAPFDASDSPDRACDQPHHRSLELQELSKVLDNALARLPESTRELLIYRYRHERSLKEAARVFSLSESAAKMRIKRGLEQLEAYLQKEGINGTEQQSFSDQG
jgi:RNA polymerase sigma-70 factor, ECF subfamily